MPALMQARRIHRAGRNGIHADTLGRIVGRDGLGQPDHRRLGNRIGRPVGHALHRRRHRRHVDDAAILAREHLRQHGLDGADLRLDIEVQGEIEIGVAHLQHRAGMDHAGAVEQHVDMADLCHRLVHGLGGEHVEHPRRHAGHAIEFGQLAGIDVGGDHLGPGGHEGLDRGAANALRGSSDEDDFAG
ncbi:hypothetical protein D3C72_1764620 [compost metagenome]